MEKSIEIKEIAINSFGVIWLRWRLKGGLFWNYTIVETIDRVNSYE